MAFPIDPSGSDLQAFLQENYAKKLRVSSRALRDYLNQGNVLENLAALDWSGATDPAALCQACHGPYLRPGAGRRLAFPVL